MRSPVTPRQLTRRRRSRRLGHRPQLRARLIGTQRLDIEHRVPATQHRVGHGDEQSPRRAAPRALLDRTQPADLRRRLDRTIKRRDQLQTPHQLTDHRRPTKRRQRPIIGDNLDPWRLTEPIPPRRARTRRGRLACEFTDKVRSSIANRTDETHAAKPPEQNQGPRQYTYSGIKVRTRPEALQAPARRSAGPRCRGSRRTGPTLCPRGNAGSCPQAGSRASTTPSPDRR